MKIKSVFQLITERLRIYQIKYKISDNWKWEMLGLLRLLLTECLQ